MFLDAGLEAVRNIVETFSFQSNRGCNIIFAGCLDSSLQRKHFHGSSDSISSYAFGHIRNFKQAVQ